METTTSTRGSEVSDFLRCRKRWFWRWVENWERKEQDGKLFFGNAFHKFLEAYYSPGRDGMDAMDDYFLENSDRMSEIEYQDLRAMARLIATNYSRKWSDYDQKNVMRVVATELKFRIPLANGIVYEGTIDWLYLDFDHHLIFSDHKTVRSIGQYEDNAVMDRQISRYWWALIQLGKGIGEVEVPSMDNGGELHWVPIRDTIYWDDLRDNEPYKFIYNLIKKDYPVPPDRLKKGNLSVAKGQKTTAALYKAALVEYDLLNPDGSVPDEYAEFIAYLENREATTDPYFKRVEVQRHPEELQAAIDEFKWTAHDSKMIRDTLRMGDTVAEALTYRNITKDCSWDCSFRHICSASMDGSDVNYLFNMFYTKTDVKEDTEVEE